jgi:hypothetical protein
LALDTSTSAGPRTKSPPPSYGIPKLAPGQLWVSSVPVGLEVHSGDSPTPRKVLGRTPLVLKARDLDRYVTVTIQKGEFGGELPNMLAFLDFTCRMTHSTVWQDKNAEGKTVQEDRARAITYNVRPDKLAIIALFQTKDHSFADLERLYPPGSNFRFSDQGLHERLAQKGVPPEFISAGIRFLHRGGKIALPDAPGWSNWLIAEATPSGQVELLDPPSSPPK